MEKLIIERIIIRNFKGIRHFDEEFGNVVTIKGKNGSGKTTIRDAFTWCLFGIDSIGKEFKIRPLDKDNKIIPKLKVEVEIKVSFNGRSYRFSRVLSEKHTDNKTSYFVNDVPCKLAEYNAKLLEIGKIEDLKLLTSLTSFFMLDTKSARKKLQDMAGDVLDIDVAKDFPAVLIALQENKTVEELRKETALSRKKSADELESIPTQISAQDELRPGVKDWDVLRKNAEAKEKEIDSISDTLEKASVGNTSFDHVKGLQKEYKEKSQELLESENTYKREILEKKSKIDVEIGKLDTQKEIMESNKKGFSSKLNNLSIERKSIEEQRATLIEEWEIENEKGYDGKVKDTCITCGKSYTQEELQGMSDSLVSDYNKAKITKLNEIEAKVKNLTTRRNEIDTEVKQIEADETSIDTRLKDAKSKITALKNDLALIPTLDVLKDTHKEYNVVKKQCEDILLKIDEENAPVLDSNVELKEKRTLLKTELKEINTELADEKLIKNIDKLKVELERKESVLQQEVANLDNTLDQIKAFSKLKIEIVENKIASMFSVIKFKMYEDNITNEGEKEICECLINGIPYGNLNTASKTVAGMDFINAYGRSVGIIVPMFVDNKESVSNLIATESQLIQLQVLEEAELKLINQ